MQNLQQPLTKKDFASTNQVKWCPGCGDYSILSSLQSVLVKVQAKKENTVFISGIGCSGRLPYYMNTFGFHTLHGRAPAFATGLKLARPELSIWLIIGDGDGFSIGSNHLFHLLRRNLNINILLINNQIYGLTKGQFSPTSEKGKVTKTSPAGSIEQPVNPVLFALSAGASFVARAVDTDKENLEAALEEAYFHSGTSFIEIFQNCHIFNDGAFENIRDQRIRNKHAVYLKHGQQLTFGKNLDRVVCSNGYHFATKKLSDKELGSSAVVHNQTDIGLAFLLSRLNEPLPLGIFRKAYTAIYEDLFVNQHKDFLALKDKYHSMFFNGEIL